MTSPLTLAQQVQLECDLRDLPDLWDLLIRHEDELLGQGEGSTLCRVWRTPADLDVVDLTDTRPKWRTDYATPPTNPASLGAGVDDQAERAAYARETGDGRRMGVLQELAGWVRLADCEMWDADEEHVEPAPHATITSEAGWLTMHLPWIEAQAWVVELALEVRGIVADLAALVGDGVTWDESTMHTEALAAHLGMSASGVRNWIAAGYLLPIGHDGKRRLYSVRDAEQIKRSTTPARRSKGQDARVGSVAWWR